MNYETFQPTQDLAAIVKCHWVLEILYTPDTPKQRVIPDGCIEMCFILGDDVRRYQSETDFILQPRAMVLGQITKPFFIQPTGDVKTFAVRFYPYGFANFIKQPINALADNETPLSDLFDSATAAKLEVNITNAASTKERIAIVEKFLLDELNKQHTIDNIVKSTIETLSQTKGNASILSMIKEDQTTRKSLERKFSAQVGVSPKQLGKIIRLQAALKSMLSGKEETLTQVAYENDYYDQSHFIRDFKEFTGTNPKDYFGNDQMILSSLIYSKD